MGDLRSDGVLRWTRVRHPETGGEAIMPVDAFPAQAARGWEPYGEPAADRMTLVIQQDTEAAAEAKAAEAHVAEAAQVTEGGAPKDDVLATVGEDPAAALAALAAESAKPPKDQRKTLISALEKIATGPDSATTEGN